jgi:hypothetical protein
VGSRAEWSEREAARHGAGSDSRALAGREARPLAVHVGGGIATRDAYHEQRAAHREALERGTAGAPERLALPVVTVPAASIVVAEGGPNYRPVVKSEGKQEKQARRRAKATAAAGGMAGGEVEPPLEGQPPVVGSESEDSDESASSDDERAARLGRTGRPRPTLCLALGQQAAVEGAAATAGTPPAPLLNPHGHGLSMALRFLRRRLCEYVAEQADVGGVVTMYDAGGGMQYPTEHWTVHFFKWLRAPHVRGGRRRLCVGAAPVRGLGGTRHALAGRERASEKRGRGGEGQGGERERARFRAQGDAPPEQVRGGGLGRGPLGRGGARPRGARTTHGGRVSQPRAEPPVARGVAAEGARARQRLAAEVCVSEISCRRTCFCCSMSHCGGRARTP